MAPTIAGVDCCTVLEVPSTATQEQIRDSYRRLALLHHPDKNTHDPSATAKFQKLQGAWETLRDPSLRKEYDKIHRTQRSPTKTPDYSGPQHAKSETHALAKEYERLSKEAKDIATKIDELHNKSCERERERHELEKPVAKLQAELSMYLKLDEEDARISREAKYLSTQFNAFFFGINSKHSPEAQQEREAAGLQRIAARRVNEPELARAQRNLEAKKAMVRQLNEEISRETAKLQKIREAYTALEEKEKRQRQAEQAEKARKQQEEAEMRRRAKRQAEAKEEKARREEKWEERQRQAEEMYKAKKQQEEMERRRRVEREAQAREAEARLKKERREAEAAMRAAFRMKPPQARSSPGISQTKGPSFRPSNACSHFRYWDRVDGGGKCEHCEVWQPKFTFMCPDCDMQACADCRRTLKGKRPRAWS